MERRKEVLLGLISTAFASPPLPVVVVVQVRAVDWGPGACVHPVDADLEELGDVHGDGEQENGNEKLGHSVAQGVRVVHGLAVVDGIVDSDVPVIAFIIIPAKAYTSTRPFSSCVPRMKGLVRVSMDGTSTYAPMDESLWRG